MSSEVMAARAPGAAWVRTGAVVLASFLLGVLTFYAQGFLPDEWRSFANSSGGWTILTALLVFASGAGTGLAAALGASSFVLLVLGYSAGASLQGLTYSPLLFGVIGLIVGPFVGIASSWLRTRDVRGAIGTALLAGILIGEAVYGLTVIADTTRPEYWIVSGSLGVVLVAVMLALRLRGWLSVAVATLGTAAVAAAFLVAYSVL